MSAAGGPAASSGATGAGSGAAGSPEQPAPTSPDEVILPVPWIEQNKDTWLLALEADAEAPDYRPWDRPWEIQPPYCARASIAMVNAYYHAKLRVPGTLSQDRLTYEVYHDRTLHEGPEVDIYVDAGMNAPMMARALEYALGAPASKRFLVPLAAWEEYVRNVNTAGIFIWETVVNELKAQRPVVGTSECHAWVYAGYRRSSEGQEFLILDPAMGTYWFRPRETRELTGGDDEPAGERLTETFFLPKLDEAQPASDEPTIKSDADSDGVMDFDEVVRFKTAVLDEDSDHDGVRDQEEIRASVFEPRHGWSVRTRNMQAGQFFPRPSETGRDLDGDGEMMELDPDSDNGGCKDGEEDVNANGIRDPGETSNFDGDDDPTQEDGTCGALWTGTMHSIFQGGDDSETTDVVVRLRETHPQRLPHPLQPGAIDGIKLVDAGSVITRTFWTDMSRSPSCVQAGHGTSSAISPPGELLRVLEDVGPRGELRWSESFYVLGLAPAGSLPFTMTCHSAYGTRIDTREGGLGSRSVNTRPSDPARASSVFGERHAPLDGGAMVGSWGDDQDRVTWSICRQGTECAPLPPLPARGEPRP